MIDIAFFMKAHPLKQRIMRGEFRGPDAGEAFALLENFRSLEPVVYNIETTNACNMRCVMCPRTTLMTRPVERLEPALFARIVSQLRPHPPALWDRWIRFAREQYGVPDDEPGENHFFLYVIPKVIQLHGYGDPLLDRDLPAHIELLTRAGFPSYFSCNPANIDLNRTFRMFESGLTYIKYSIETVDDELHRQIRGRKTSFDRSREDILRLLDWKTRRNCATTVVITMLNLNRCDQSEQFERLREAFRGCDVYLYLKSENGQWYRRDYHPTQSIHWSEMCQHPWMSMTVKSNGEVAMCPEDFNNEIVLGDARLTALRDIWNGPAYARFRRGHLFPASDLKCRRHCDMPILGELCLA